MALGHTATLKIDLGKYAEAADDPSDRIPVHLHQIALFLRRLYFGYRNCAHGDSPLSSVRTRPVPSGQLGSRVSPLGFLVDGVIGEGAQRADRTPINGGGVGRD